jgi:hypothetical protein
MSKLTDEIKMLLKKGDTATADAGQHYKAAGEKLIELRKNKTKKEFEAVVAKECGIKTNWAYTLMRIAKGQTTLAEIRGQSAKRKKKYRRKKRAFRNAQHEPEHKEPGKTPQERWQGSLDFMAAEAIALPAYWRKTFGEWKEFEVSSASVTLAQQAAEAWAQIAEDVTKRAGAIPLRRTTHG